VKERNGERGCERAGEQVSERDGDREIERAAERVTERERARATGPERKRPRSKESAIGTAETVTMPTKPSAVASCRGSRALMAREPRTPYLKIR
jgi:hypothetical protein